MTDPDLTRPHEPDPGARTPAGPPASSRLRTRGGDESGSDAPTIRSRGAGSGSGPTSPRDSALAELQPGRRIDIFELQQAIGAGGMGAVFRALDTRLHRQVALKLLPPEQGGDAEVLQRFYQEGQAAAQLDHENIARVYTIGNDGDLHYIAFEYIEGTTIRQRVEQNGPQPVGEAINYTLQIASALVHAAERGVVHRDIKPSNIIVTPQGRAKLVDMGLARRFERGGDHSLTQSGMTLGTFDYISPEQARDPRNVDVRSDLYSLGCTLFHMLTGRPPFPEGTVLQKLLQHQEDTPPDVRALNPQVPPDLAAILVKLMAKDRDRRYQSPEQLVRDLLTVAGSLGLRSISPEGLVWMAATARPAWERHLVWALPGLALAAVVCVLLIWGREGEAPPPLTFAGEPAPAVAPVAPSPTAEKVAGPSRPASARPAASTAAPTADRTKPTAARTATPAAPGRFRLDEGDDLASAVAAAPSGSVIELTHRGPFDLRGATPDGSAPLEIEGRDLTIRAAAGVRPLIRLSRSGDPGEDRPVTALASVRGGHVVFEGVEFQVDPGSSDEPLDTIVSEDADLSLRRCLFHRPASGTSLSHLAALHARASAPSVSSRVQSEAGRSQPVVVDACHFGGDQAAIVAHGPVDVSLRDCTLARNEPALSLDNPASSAGASAVLHLSHVSVLAGDGPVFRLVGTGFRVVVDDSVVAPSRKGEVTLVAASDPESVDWLGRGNLYARVGTFLRTTRGTASRAPVQRFTVWADGTSPPREVDSVSSNAFVWAEPDPDQALARDNPTRAFVLGAPPRTLANVGTRRGPWGAISNAAEVASPASTSQTLLAARDDETRATPPLTPRRGETERSSSGDRLSTEGAPEPAPLGVGGSPMARMDDDPDLPIMPPMNREDFDETTTPSPTASGSGSAPRESSPASGADATSRPRNGTDQERSERTGAAGSSSTAGGARVEPDGLLIRTATQFQEALKALGTKGGTIRLADDADMELPGCEIQGSGRWIIRPEATPTSKASANRPARPRLRFTPAASEARRPPALFRLAGGTLEIQGVDIVLEDARSPVGGRWAAFASGAGTEVSLTDCTVTVEGDHPRSAIVSVSEGDVGARAGAAANPEGVWAASFRATDCLLRSGGDLVDVAPGRRLELELTDSIVATSGSLVHAHGVARGQDAEPLKLVLRQVTARVAGGLVLLESAASEPELPVADVLARDTIVATTPQGDPLFRVDGQDAIDDLRDRVRWEGHNVAYHQIGTYRRDQTRQIGTLPVSYDRPSWEVAVAPRDEAPVHGDLKFSAEGDLYRAPWAVSPSDMLLSEDSPARTTGAETRRIPSPPRPRSSG